jgi:DNA-binding NarL/FixJ family response regulator
MPGTDGLTATRQLKDRFPEARVIIVSNHGEAEFRRAAEQTGVCGFVHKEHLEQLAPLIIAAEKNHLQP